MIHRWFGVTGMWAGIVLALLVLTTGGPVTAAAPGSGRALPTPGAVGTIAQVRITVDAASERQAYYADLARQIIDLGAGQSLTPSAVENAIDVLKSSRRFATIDVDASPAAGGEVLTFHLTPYRYIEAIHIAGQYPLFERDVLNQMTLYPGDPYTQADLNAQVDAIVDRYRREGYIDPQVTVKAHPDPQGEYDTITVDIDKGPHYRLGNLRFVGNRGLSADTLRWRMQVWRATLIPGIGRFSEYRLKKDIERLVGFYRRKGFADASITYRMTAPDRQHRIDVTVRIDEGRRYAVVFEGNDHFWEFTLKKDLTLFTDGNRNDIGIRRSVRQMRDRYRAAGYLDARIETSSTEVAGEPVPVRRLRIDIHEGPRSLVEKVTITGNRDIPDETLRKQILTRPTTLFHDGAFNPDILETDILAVKTIYLRQGFQDSAADTETTFSDDRTAVEIDFAIEEGPQTIVRSIAVTGSTIVAEDAARRRLVHRIGDPFRRAALDVEKEAITALVAEQGYPHAVVTPEVSISDDRTRADIRHHVEPGPQVTLGGVFIAGNQRTDESIIRRELNVPTGEPLSLQSLHDGQRRLRDLEIFHGVAYRLLGLKAREETVNLFVDIEENKPYYAQVSGGYESDSGFYARTRIGDRNLFGLNKHLWAGGEVSQTGYRIETRLTEPRLLGTRVLASIGAFNEERTEFNQPFGTRTTGGSLSFGRDWGDHIDTALTFSLERRDQFSVDNTGIDPTEAEPRTIFVTTPYIRYDSRDSFVRPTEGLLTSLSVDVSKGLDDELDDFVRYQVDVRYYVTPWERLTLAALGRVGQVHSYSDSDRVPDDQLFFLGGIGDVRGFKENLLRFDRLGDPVGGRTAVVGSLEARIDLGLNFELTTFFDIGSVRDAIVDEGSSRFRPTAGIGLRYITPIGPMGLLYGHKLDRQEEESAGRWHLSIGYSF